MKKYFTKKNIIISLIIVIVSLITTTYISNQIVVNNAHSKLYTDVNQIPKNKVGLLLGTSKYLSNGNINLYYQYRIEATVLLFQKQKIEFVLISGDNSNKRYDEPTTMKNDLIAAGIPAEKIYLDYAGFRTLDSIVRAKEIFGQQRFTVISQQFHNERAIYLGNAYDIDVIGFNCKDVTVYYGFKTQLREKLARVKLIIDIAFDKQPRFKGEKIEIK